MTVLKNVGVTEGKLMEFFMKPLLWNICVMTMCVVIFVGCAHTKYIDQFNSVNRCVTRYKVVDCVSQQQKKNPSVLKKSDIREMYGVADGTNKLMVVLLTEKGRMQMIEKNGMTIFENDYDNDGFFEELSISSVDSGEEMFFRRVPDGGYLIPVETSVVGERGRLYKADSE